MQVYDVHNTFLTTTCKNQSLLWLLNYLIINLSILYISFYPSIYLFTYSSICKSVFKADIWQTDRPNWMTDKVSIPIACVHKVNTYLGSFWWRKWSSLFMSNSANKNHTFVGWWKNIKNNFFDILIQNNTHLPHLNSPMTPLFR